MITIGCDTRGAAVEREWITAAKPRHPSLLDEHHRVADLYNVRNFPSAFWIDEMSLIVRANDPIYATRRSSETGEAIVNHTYLNAVRDWVANGRQSPYVHDEITLNERRGHLNRVDMQASASFQLGLYLVRRGHQRDAIAHFKRAHGLRPSNWRYKRQAWSLANIEEDYGTTIQAAIVDPEGGPFYPPLGID